MYACICTHTDNPVNTFHTPKTLFGCVGCTFGSGTAQAVRAMPVGRDKSSIATTSTTQYGGATATIKPRKWKCYNPTYGGARNYQTYCLLVRGLAELAQYGVPSRGVSDLPWSYGSFPSAGSTLVFEELLLVFGSILCFSSVAASEEMQILPVRINT